MFYMRYLPIVGLSKLSYPITNAGAYDERHIPARFRQPYTGAGVPAGAGWTDRPDHDRNYPEICVPAELHTDFTVANGTSQMMLVDLHVPTGQATGTYTGTFTVTENGVTTIQIPVSLVVKNFTLSNVPPKRMISWFGSADINRRIMGSSDTANGTQDTAHQAMRKSIIQTAWRHGVTMMESPEYRSNVAEWSTRAPTPLHQKALSGTLFASGEGYGGRGEGGAHDFYCIEPYAQWGARWGLSQAAYRTNIDTWENWFLSNAPSVERMIYIQDESTDWATQLTYLGWHNGNAGVGVNVKTFLTANHPDAYTNLNASGVTQNLDYCASWRDVFYTTTWEPAYNYWNASGRKGFYYNGKRPAMGCFATEAPGADLVSLAYMMQKFDAPMHFFWDVNYWWDYQASGLNNNLWNDAKTFGVNSAFYTPIGRSGYNYSNGDGVLMYPGTDVLAVDAADNYGLTGVFPSLRLKALRRGIQDADYIEQARAIDSVTVDALVDTAVPIVGYETGVDDPLDPTYKHMAVSWDESGNTWGGYRTSLRNIIAP